MRSRLQLLALILLLSGLALIGANIFNKTTESVIDIPEAIDLGLYELERDDGGYFTILNYEGNVLDKTARQVYVGDEFIAADNRHYRVAKIEGDTAFADLIGTREASFPSSWGKVDMPVGGAIPVQGNQGAPLIAIYHTHSAESYIPSEGEAFIKAKGQKADGGIIDVGEVLNKRLQELGFRTVINTSSHEPHDANAYYRSRRTAVQLLKEQPNAIIDVHRDAVPVPDFYRTQLDGKEISKIRLVVGRQNQNKNANLEFAEQIKAVADEMHPGLMHGIFLARGNYNQDLAPRSILIEAGTHVTSREEAEKSMAFFAETLPRVLGVPGERAPTTGGDLRSLIWVIGLSLLAGGTFLLISTGSLEGARDKLKQFVGEEWANYLGSKLKYKKANVYQSSLNKKAFKLEENQDAEQKPDN